MNHHAIFSDPPRFLLVPSPLFPGILLFSKPSKTKKNGCGCLKERWLKRMDKESTLEGLSPIFGTFNLLNMSISPGFKGNLCPPRFAGFHGLPPRFARRADDPPSRLLDGLPKSGGRRGEVRSDDGRLRHL